MKTYSFVALIAFSVIGCRTFSTNVDSSLQSSLKTEKAFDYTCTSKSNDLGLSRQAKIKFSESRVSVLYKDTEAELNEMFGEIDSKYKPRSNPNAIRYKTFDWGADCELILVVDGGVRSGSIDHVNAKFSCSAEGLPQFQTFECESPTSARMKLDTQRPAASPSVELTHTCSGDVSWFDFKTIKIGAQEDKLTLRYGPKITSAYPQNEPLDGVRNFKYKPRNAANKNMLQYKMAWGGDCALSVLVDREILNSTSEVPLTIQCSSDDEFHQSKLKCRKL
jgi:hypothetical protein